MAITHYKDYTPIDPESGAVIDEKSDFFKNGKEEQVDWIRNPKDGNDKNPRSVGTYDEDNKEWVYNDYQDVDGNHQEADDPGDPNDKKESQQNGNPNPEPTTDQ